jgi:hypothetical protein
MFALTDLDGARSILGCADGPASFNAEAAARGWRLTSADPLYRCSAADIHSRCVRLPVPVLHAAR